MTRIGTSHFLSYAAAHRYFRPYFGNETAPAVSEKIRAGEIHIGRPETQAGESLVLIDNGTRWAIVTNKRGLFAGFI